MPVNSPFKPSNRCCIASQVIVLRLAEGLRQP